MKKTKLNINSRAIIIYNNNKDIISIEAYVYSIDTNKNTLYILDTLLTSDSFNPSYSFACSIDDKEINKPIKTTDLLKLANPLCAWKLKNETLVFNPDILYVYEISKTKLIENAIKKLKNTLKST